MLALLVLHSGMATLCTFFCALLGPQPVMGSIRGSIWELWNVLVRHLIYSFELVV